VIDRRRVPRKAEFRSRMNARYEPNGTWTLRRDLVYASIVTGKVYRVPSGFNSDLASVPRLPIVYLMVANTATEPAVLHDYLYRTGVEDRTTCDAIFREAMEATGVPAWRRNLMWLGVRVGGRRHHVSTTSNPANVAPPSAPASVANEPLGD
jgi:hypothetical protein